MKKHLVRLLVLTATLTLLGLTLAQTSAMAHHGKGHHQGGHCLNNPHDHDFKSETEEMSKQERKEYKREHLHHQHKCNKNQSEYPPRIRRPNAAGQSATFPVDSPNQGGVSVGTATLVAMGGLGALLLVRRRWVFRTNR